MQIQNDTLNTGCYRDAVLFWCLVTDATVLPDWMRMRIKNHITRLISCHRDTVDRRDWHIVNFRFYFGIVNFNKFVIVECVSERRNGVKSTDLQYMICVNIFFDFSEHTLSSFHVSIFMALTNTNTNTVTYFDVYAYEMGWDRMKEIAFAAGIIKAKGSLCAYGISVEHGKIPKTTSL